MTVRLIVLALSGALGLALVLVAGCETTERTCYGGTVWSCEPRSCVQDTSGDGVCDEVFNCAGWDYDEGDCASGGSVCTETCEWSNDGGCDDGGAGATTSLCDYGTDCIDCGARAAP